jgi:hypothetical protein
MQKKCTIIEHKKDSPLDGVAKMKKILQSLLMI